MNPAKLLRAVFLPLIETAVLFPVVMFWIFVSIGTRGGPLGLVVLILSLPPMFRYVMIVLETTAKGEVPGAFDAEFFNWTGSLWTLFPLPLVLGLGYVGISAWQTFGDTGVYVVLAVACLIVPASLAVLAITHSPVQSLNPVAIWRLHKTAASSFWFASFYLLLVGIVAIQVEVLPTPAANFIQIVLMYSFAAVTGSLIQPYGLVDDVSIPLDVERSEAEVAGNLEQARVLELTHAYAFISRGNRDGGFRHIMDWIGREADTRAAWAWFFERMLGWERKEHALFFAQHYVHELLINGQEIPALKVIMRCRLLNERFKPFADDLPAAIEAAENSGNIELVTVLKRA